MISEYDIIIGVVVAQAVMSFSLIWYAYKRCRDEEQRKLATRIFNVVEVNTVIAGFLISMSFVVYISRIFPGPLGLPSSSDLHHLLIFGLALLLLHASALFFLVPLMRRYRSTFFPRSRSGK